MLRTRIVLGFATTEPPTPRSEPDTSEQLRKGLVGEGALHHSMKICRVPLSDPQIPVSPIRGRKVAKRLTFLNISKTAFLKLSQAHVEVKLSTLKMLGTLISLAPKDPQLLIAGDLLIPFCSVCTALIF